MPSLHEVQMAFAAVVSGGSLPFPYGAGADSAAASMAVYRNNMVGNLSDALRSVYTGIETLVGREFFDHAAAAYVDTHPSHSGNLNDYGAQFPAFLARFPGLEALPYVEDMARLEWACHESLLAPEHGPMDLVPLGDVEPRRYGDLCFRLHPAARLVASEYPLFRIWRLCEAPDREPGIDLADGAERLLVTRPGAKVELEVLPAAEFALLDAMAHGVPFGFAGEQALALDGDLDLAATLQRCVLAGVIVAWSLMPGDCRERGES